jgi:hypothetical protein
MPLNVVLTIAAVCAFASAVNGILGAAFLLFTWMVLMGMIRQSEIGPVVIAQWTWTPHLLLPVALFLIVWQVWLRGRIGPQFGLRDLFFRRRTDSFA